MCTKWDAHLFRKHGHEVSTVDSQDLGGASDDELIEACRTEERALVTLDLDFSNVLRFPPERYAGIAVLRVPHPIELTTIRDRVRVLLTALEQSWSPRDASNPNLSEVVLEASALTRVQRQATVVEADHVLGPLASVEVRSFLEGTSQSSRSAAWVTRKAGLLDDGQLVFDLQAAILHR